MNLLIISNNLKRASFRQRIGVYLDTLRTNGIVCEVAKLPTGSLGRRKLFKQAADFDGVFLHKKNLNIFDAFWLGRYSRKIIYDFDDAIMYSPKAPQRNSLSHFAPFRRTTKLADLVIAGNSYLAEHARKFNSTVEVLPTGLNTKEYISDEKPEGDDKIRLVWIGSKSTLRYLAEIKPALEEIGARFNNVVLRIISDEFFDLRNMSVEKHPWSEQTQVNDLVTSDIGIAPLPDNRFTRGKCGFKILQYAAAGLAVITSPIGVNAEYVRHGVTGFHAANTLQWIEKIAELIEKPGLRKTMGREGQEQVKNFSVEVIGKRIVDLIMRIVAQS